MGFFHIEHERFLSLVHLLYPGHGFRGSSEAIFVGVDLLRFVVVGNGKMKLGELQWDHLSLALKNGFVTGTPQKTNMVPPRKRRFQNWKPSFLGSMLVFGGVCLWF